MQNQLHVIYKDIQFKLVEIKKVMQNELHLIYMAIQCILVEIIKKAMQNKPCNI